MNCDSLKKRLLELSKPAQYSVKDSAGNKKYYRLVMVNYKPVTRRIGDKIEYAFLDMSEEVPYVVFKTRYRSKSPSGRVAGTADKWSIEEFMQTFDNGFFLKKFMSITTEGAKKVELYEKVSAEYDGLLPELEALLIKTSDFLALEKRARGESEGMLRVHGWDAPDTVHLVNAPQVDRTLNGVIKYWYDSYMLDVNLQLMDIYYVMSSKKPILPAMRRMAILDEFVPFLMKFSGIYNPVLDTDVFQSLRRSYPLIKSLETVTGTCLLSARIIDKYMGDETSYTMYVLRGNLTRLYGFTLDKSETGKARDSYSPYLFAKVFLTGALEGIDEQMDALTLVPYRVYTLGSGENLETSLVSSDVFEGSYMKIPCTADRSVQWLEGDLINYMLNRGMKSNQPELLQEVDHFASRFREGMSVAQYMTQEVI